VKLGIHSRHELIAAAARSGILLVADDGPGPRSAPLKLG
jgi:hypothetical protein